MSFSSCIMYEKLGLWRIFRHCDHYENCTCQKQSKYDIQLTDKQISLFNTKINDYKTSGFFDGSPRLPSLNYSNFCFISVLYRDENNKRIGLYNAVTNIDYNGGLSYANILLDNDTLIFISRKNIKENEMFFSKHNFKSKLIKDISQRITDDGFQCNNCNIHKLK